MSKIKIAATIATIGLMVLVGCRLQGVAQPPQPRVQLTTEPPVGQFLPFEAESAKPQSPVRLTLQALSGSGQPLKNAKIHLTLLTPPQNPWFPTDFPVVEGTRLLEIETLAPQGKLQFQQMLPVRGTYRLRVAVTPVVANQFSPIEQTLTFSVPENPVKWQNFGLLMAILLLVGLGSGWLMGGKQPIESGEIAPYRVRLLLSGAMLAAIAALLVVNISAELAESEEHGHLHAREHSPSTANQTVVNAAGIKLQLSGDRDATVGKLANFQLQAINTQTGKPATDVAFSIQTTQLEDNWVSFAYTGKTDATGRLAWQQQFFDGAPHQVVAEIAPDSNSASQFPPLRVQKAIAVEGVAPPLSGRLIVLTYFTGTIGLGLALGLRLRRSFAR